MYCQINFKAAEKQKNRIAALFAGNEKPVFRYQNRELKPDGFLFNPKYCSISFHIEAADFRTLVNICLQLHKSLKYPPMRLITLESGHFYNNYRVVNLRKGKCRLQTSGACSHDYRIRDIVRVSNLEYETSGYYA